MTYQQRWPVPTTPPPTFDEIERMVIDIDDCTATDGCVIEPDGSCQHGYPSWLIELGLL